MCVCVCFVCIYSSWCVPTMCTKHNLHVARFVLWYMHICIIISHTPANALHLTCTACDPGTYCFQDNSFACPVHSSSPAMTGNISDCRCLPGYYKAFDAGNDNSVSCQACPTGSYCVNDVLYDCVQHSESLSLSSSHGDCKCSAGFTGIVASAEDTNACQPCTA